MALFDSTPTKFILKNTCKKLWLVLLLFLSGSVMGQNVKESIDRLVQRFDAIQGKEFRTAVYLKTNKDVYVSGEDLWFSAVVLDAQFFTLNQIDQNLYVALYSLKSDTAIWKEVYPITQGVASGHVYLPQSLSEGNYVLKAFTGHGLSTDPYVHALAALRVVKDLKTIRPSLLMQGRPKEIKQSVQLDIFPEGGDLVAGLENYVSVKAVKRDGTPQEVSGSLMKGGVAILHFRTTHAGMGRFSFTPLENAAYEIKLHNTDVSKPMPRIRDSGVLLHLMGNEKDTLRFTLRGTSGMRGKRLFIRLQLRGMIIAMASTVVSDSAVLQIPVHDAAQGIAEATLFDEALQPIAERLVYLHPERRLRINVLNAEKVYKTKGKVSLHIKTTDDSGMPVPAIVNISVFDSLFYDAGQKHHLASYFYLGTQLRGSIFNPTYYFDTTNANRVEHLDLLLTTQGWRRYAWNEDNVKELWQSNAGNLVKDSIELVVEPIGKKTGKYPISLLLFNYNRSNSRISVTDQTGKLNLTPEDLAIAPRIFIKYFSNDDYKVTVPDPFAKFEKRDRMVSSRYPIVSFAADSDTVSPVDSSDLLQYGQTMESVIVTGKSRGFNDRYLGSLDSLAKYENNTDFVGLCGWLNCPACGSGKKPVEGVVYSELTESRRQQVFNHPFSFTANEMRKVSYSYPKFTEEELLTKYKMSVTKGYYNTRQFYEPDYDKEPQDVIDQRNALFWKPRIVTNQHGAANVSFFCSDIKSRFVGFIEGVTENGLLGVQKISFSVRE